MFKMNRTRPQDFRFMHWLIVPVLLIVAGLYGLLTIAPFFMLGLHQQPANLVIGGAFDPKGLPGLHPLVHSIGFLLILITPIMIAIFGPLLLIYARRHWTLIPRTERLLITSVGIGSLALLVFMFTSPLARLITTWWLD